MVYLEWSSKCRPIQHCYHPTSGQCGPRWSGRWTERSQYSACHPESCPGLWITKIKNNQVHGCYSRYFFHLMHLYVYINDTGLKICMDFFILFLKTRHCSSANIYYNESAHKLLYNMYVVWNLPLGSYRLTEAVQTVQVVVGGDVLSWRRTQRSIT